MEFDFTCSTWQSTGSSISLKSSKNKHDHLKCYVCRSKMMHLFVAGNLLEVSWFLWEHPHVKVSVLIGLKGGGHNKVFSRGKTKAGAHFPQVDEGFRARCWAGVFEEVSLQMHLPFARVLENNTHAAQSHEGALHHLSSLFFISLPYFCHTKACDEKEEGLWIVSVYIPPQVAGRRQKKKYE